MYIPHMGTMLATVMTIKGISRDLLAFSALPRGCHQLNDMRLYHPGRTLNKVSHQLHDLRKLFGSFSMTWSSCRVTHLRLAHP